MSLFRGDEGGDRRDSRLNQYKERKEERRVEGGGGEKVES